jgi:hypothetical protein
VFWKRTDLPSLEDQEAVLHDGQEPLAYRKLGFSQENARGVIQELL